MYLRPIRDKVRLTHQLIENHLNNNSNLNEKKLIQNKHEITFPLREVRNSLKLNKGDHIANADLLDLMRRVRCFGINLARLDIRQEADRHEKLLNEIFKKKSKIGGKYGTQVALNYSRINGLNGGHSVLTESGSHTPMFFSIQNEELFFRDFNIDLKKKLSKKVKLVANYVDLIYNKDVIEGKNNGKNIHARIGIVELNYKLKPKHTIISEVQYLSVDKDDTYYQDQGDWIMGLVEYTISPHWFFAIMDQYNGGYTSEGKTYDAVHYLNISCGYSKGTNRFELGYGKKREGIFCVGGVCREVPSSNGFTLSITSSF